MTARTNRTKATPTADPFDAPGTVPAAEASPAKAPVNREPIVTGDVTIGISEDTTFSVQRKSRLDSDPVAQAVKAANPDVAYDVACEAGKEEAVVKMLRRAGNRYNRGLRISKSPGMVKFMVGEKRLTKAQAAAKAAKTE